jgi:hypothetical protein
VLWRFAGGVKRASSVDWPGQKHAVPMPNSPSSAAACQPLRISGKSETAVACSSSPPTSVLRPPARSTIVPAASPDATYAAAATANAAPAAASEIPRTLCR